MHNTLFTVGHSAHSLEKFIDLLKQHKIDAIADVRSTPYSRFQPQFNKDFLNRELSARGLKYVGLGKELGARRAERAAYDGQIARYELISQLPLFTSGLARLKEGARRYRIALMCAEKDPLECHRTILICRNLRHHFLDGMLHILEDGSIESQTDAEARLLSELKLNANQGDFFAESHEHPLDRAYRLRGEAIAYQENTADEG